MDFLTDLFHNVVANIVSTAILATVVLIPVLLRFRKQRKLIAFLGLHRSNRVIVYFSSLRLEHDVVNLAGIVQRWQGRALSGDEFEAVQLLDRWLYPLFGQKTRLLEVFYEYFGGIVSRSAINQVDYRPSPSSVTDLDLQYATVIIVGGAGYNLASKTYVDENRCLLETDDAANSIRVNRGQMKGRLIQPSRQLGDANQTIHEVARLEKLYDFERQSTVFIAEGMGTNGTLSAVNFLINNWSELVNRHQNKAFAVCLECASREFDRSAFKSPKLLLELSDDIAS